jgi:3-carboxy-cis,cis-muconate cycloisomerase
MARLSSSTSEPALAWPEAPGLFDAASGSVAVCAATSDRSWVQAMLDVEAALAAGGARVGLLPEAAATQIAAACQFELYDVAAIARGVATDATPVVELVRQLRALVAPDVQQHVHLVATSQDIVDTATMLVARRALHAALGDARAVASTLAALAVEHRDTVQAGRTLLQHGAVTTFGAQCASRLVAVDDAIAGVERFLRDRCAV